MAKTKIIASDIIGLGADTEMVFKNGGMLGDQPMLRALWNGKRIKLRNARVAVLDEESAKRFVGSAAAGAVGMLALGPFGLLAGALAGGNRKTGRFLIEIPTRGKLAIETNDKKCIRAMKNLAAASLLG